MKFPGWISALDPIAPVKIKLSAGGNKGMKLLIDFTNSIVRPRVDEYFGEKLFLTDHPDEGTMRKVTTK
jgi:hypothetical protein